MRSHSDLIVEAVKDEVFSMDLEQPENIDHALRIVEGAAFALAAITKKAA